MEDFFEKPSAQDAPTGAKAEAPWSAKIEYKSGKTPEAFADAATPQQVKAGFSSYDKDAKARSSKERFAITVIAMAYGAGGYVPVGNEYEDYTSNLVLDSRTQELRVVKFVPGNGKWESVVIAKGLYSIIKPSLPNGVGFEKYAVCFLHGEQKCVLLKITASLESAMVAAIAAASGIAPGKISLFSIADGPKKWAFKFNGQFAKKTKEGHAWAGKGDMFFHPVLEAGVVNPENFPVFSVVSNDLAGYVQSTQAALIETKELLQPGPSQTPAVQHTAPAFQANEPTPEQYPFPPTPPPGKPEDTGVGQGDDLPF